LRKLRSPAATATRLTSAAPTALLMEKHPERSAADDGRLFFEDPFGYKTCIRN